jgi:type IV secretory pathway VirB3-like protein
MANSRISINTSTARSLVVIVVVVVVVVVSAAVIATVVVVVVLKVWLDVKRDGRIVEICVHSMSEA